MLETAERNARPRAIQWRLDLMSDFLAFPTTLRCCEPLSTAAVAATHNRPTTEEINREWTYDTGAGTCFIGE